jgi:hypothetical protein
MLLEKNLEYEIAGKNYLDLKRKTLNSKRLLMLSEEARLEKIHARVIGSDREFSTIP